MRTIDIPTGQAVLRDQRAEIRERHTRIVNNATVAALPALQKVVDREQWEETGEGIRVDGLSRQDMDALSERQDAQIIALLVSWTLPTLLPNMDTIQDLDPDTYASLLAASREITNTTDVFSRPSFQPTPQSDGSETPTVRSEDSEQSLSADQAPKPRRKSSAAGVNISTGSSSQG